MKTTYMDNKVNFDYVTRADGSSYFEEFLASIPVKDQAKLLATIQNVQRLGLYTAERMEWIKKLDKNVYEIRSKVSSNIQRAIYFQDEGTCYLITHGFTKKKTRRLPGKS
ncbi:type II toxin-antitoxin system RelE/ParE family toxin [Listeria grayi]|uniref:type II toxin-antitoxin system RelE/ParE family toxin n=1 Tax=Listeria grayi TaxID=1641 RepID=UPI0021155B12|nr:type II toxin-antitoxin system RelE/ParE family toxin [Listeria grayi]